MNNLRKKILSITTIVLLLSLAGLTLGATPASANDKSASYIFVTATPNPIGLGQSIPVVIFMSAVTPDAVEHTGSKMARRNRRHHQPMNH